MLFKKIKEFLILSLYMILISLVFFLGKTGSELKHHFIVDTDIWVVSKSYPIHNAVTLSDHFRGTVPLPMPQVLKCIHCDEVASFYEGKLTRWYIDIDEIGYESVLPNNQIW